MGAAPHDIRIYFRFVKKAMKLIYISHWRFPSEKAFSPFAMKTCEGFAKEGMDVELWVPRRRNPHYKNTDPFSYYGVRKNFIVRRFLVLDLMGMVPGHIGFLLLVATFNLSVALYMLMRRMGRGEIFYFHDIRDTLLLGAVARNSFFEIHDFYKTGIQRINKWCLSRAQGLIVTNRIKVAALQRDFGVPSDRILHQPNAVDVERFVLSASKKEARAALKLPQDFVMVLYAGHLYGWKGVDTVLAAHQCLDPGAVIYFNGGTDDDIERFRVKARKSGAENVVIAGRRPYAETPLWLRSADVLVLPNTGKDQASKYETSPLKLFEYMASGSPIVASDLPSVRDIVDECMVWFFEPDNPDALCAAIRRCLANTEESEKRAARARAAAENFTWEKRSRAIADFVKKNYT